jgi:hypothetical protein
VYSNRPSLRTKCGGAKGAESVDIRRCLSYFTTLADIISLPWVSIGVSLECGCYRVDGTLSTCPIRTPCAPLWGVGLVRCNLTLGFNAHLSVFGPSRSEHLREVVGSCSLACARAGFCGL